MEELFIRDEKLLFLYIGIVDTLKKAKYIKETEEKDYFQIIKKIPEKRSFHNEILKEYLSLYGIKPYDIQVFNNMIEFIIEERSFV